MGREAVKLCVLEFKLRAPFWRSLLAGARFRVSPSPPLDRRRFLDLSIRGVVVA